VLVTTGTRDNALEGGWKSRTIAYADMSPGCKRLDVVDGATHFNFAGIGLAAKTEELTIGATSSLLNNLRNGACSTPVPVRGISMEAK